MTLNKGESKIDKAFYIEEEQEPFNRNFSSQKPQFHLEIDL